jgi:hypothetical protein
MSDDRAERLRENRNRAKQRAQDGNSSGDDQSQSETSKLSKQSKPSQQSKSSKQETVDQPPEESENSDPNGDSKHSNVKKDQVGTYMYLPEKQHQELSRQFNLLKAEYEYEYNEEFEKNRHFYPLVIEHGLESLESLDASEIQERLESLDD